jgi:hypothetical protein
VKRAFAVALALFAVSAEASEGKKAEWQNRVQEVGASYVAKIRPIFQAKCFDCHSDHPTYPWYYKIPGVKQLIDSDIAEGREYLDLSRDFPFKGHGADPIDKTLEEIGETITEGSMPPWYYRPFHPGSKITDEEAKQILAWVRESREMLLIGP